jgi:peptidyl-prolyl cis-trans isomerase A (cyclophilin A)
MPPRLLGTPADSYDDAVVRGQQPTPSQFALCLGLAAATALSACGKTSSHGSGPTATSAGTLALRPPSPAEALRGLDPSKPIVAIVRTDHGDIRCELDARHAPKAVALFVGLATGRAVWRDPRTGGITRRPLYENLTFHRAIPGVMVQSGCVVGDASGNPGYRIPVEPSADDRERLARPGVLTLARYTAPPFRRDPNPPPPGAVLGSQFAISLTDMSHLSGQVTVLGGCKDLDVVRAIAREYRRGHPGARLIRVSVPGAE